MSYGCKSDQNRCRLSDTCQDARLKPLVQKTKPLYSLHVFPFNPFIPNYKVDELLYSVLGWEKWLSGFTLKYCFLLLLQNLSSCLWWLFNQEPGRLYVELQFFCAVFNFGQVIIYWELWEVFGFPRWVDLSVGVRMLFSSIKGFHLFASFGYKWQLTAAA